MNIVIELTKTSVFQIIINFLIRVVVIIFTSIVTLTIFLLLIKNYVNPNIIDDIDKIHHPVSVEEGV